MTPKNTDSSSRGWYTVSVETLRALAVFSIVLALTAVGWALYRGWSEARLAEETRQLLQEVESLLETARREAKPNAPFSEELASARGNYEEAKAALAAKEFRKAATAARRSYDLLTALFDAATARGAGEAQFIAVQGRVEFRRGERGDWEEARSRTVLYSGDYVKTASNGSAEIVFLDGTLYTVRPNTLFVVARSSRSLSGAEQTIRMEYGWVNLNTAQRTSRITTPKAEARIGQESEASVVFDRESKRGRYVSFRGTVEVKDEAGTVRQLKALEQVTEENGRLSEPRPIPKPPILLSPGDNHVAVLGQDTTLELRWEPVEGADRYLLQVSRNRLFVDNIIDVANRRKTVATLGLRGEGTFEWRAAAQTRDGIQGPWSTPRTFRVVGAPSEADQGDRTPPILELDRVQSLGAFVLISGRTEPGARVFINGEETAVAANGTFSKTIELQNEGWNFVELIAVDASGNQMKRQQRVFLESL